MRKNSPKNKIIVITGGSSGIGYAAADNLLGKGATICLVANNEEKLRRATEILREKHPDSDLQYYAVDVKNNKDVKDIVRKIVERNVRIDWLLNSAGIAEPGRFESQPSDIMHRVMDTNYWGAAYFTLAALPYMKQSSGAAIAFVSSIAGYIGLFGYSHYVPSKFAVTGLAECLRMEFNDYNISVTVIYPPDTQTPMYEREQENTLPECKALTANAVVLLPEVVAAKLIDGMMNGKFEIYCNVESRLIRLFRNVTPITFFHFADGIINRSRKKATKVAGSP
jgi:3-dehydrosphinganine reductase